LAIRPKYVARPVDFFILRGIASLYMEVELSSGHSPAITTTRMSAYAIRKSTTPTLITKQTNWDSFRTYIEEHISLNLRIKEPNELDEVTQCFTTLIQEAACYSTPTPKEGRKKIDNIPFHIRELVTEKRRPRSE
jgi:hypothetical protein